MDPKTVSWDFWALFYPAPDVPGQWVGHCLNLDVVSQGDSLDHARGMLAEAVVMIIDHEFSVGRNPTDRKTAPEDDWALLRKVVADGKPGSFSDLAKSEANLIYVAANLHFVVTFDVLHAQPGVAEIPLPPAWMIPSLSTLASAHS